MNCNCELLLKCIIINESNIFGNFNFILKFAAVKLLNYHNFTYNEIRTFFKSIFSCNVETENNKRALFNKTWR